MAPDLSVRDLIEVLVGDLYEEGEQEEIEALSEGVYRISGGASIDEVNELLSLNIDAEEYDTFGGYVLALLGEVPADGTKPVLETDEMEIKVEKVSKRRIISSVITKKQTAGLEE